MGATSCEQQCGRSRVGTVSWGRQDRCCSPRTYVATAAKHQHLGKISVLATEKRDQCRHQRKVGMALPALKLQMVPGSSTLLYRCSTSVYDVGSTERIPEHHGLLWKHAVQAIVVALLATKSWSTSSNTSSFSFSINSCNCHSSTNSSSFCAKGYHPTDICRVYFRSKFLRPCT